LIVELQLTDATGDGACLIDQIAMDENAVCGVAADFQDQVAECVRLPVGVLRGDTGAEGDRAGSAVQGDVGIGVAQPILDGILAVATAVRVAEGALEP
jgi:hypothetical protein